LDDKGFPNIIIEVDGNCSFENVPKMCKTGAEIIVAGSSSLFNKSVAINDAVSKMRMSI
jgi:ribulose-phosphate 3-epimerase